MGGRTFRRRSPAFPAGGFLAPALSAPAASHGRIGVELLARQEPLVLSQGLLLFLREVHGIQGDLFLGQGLLVLLQEYELLRLVHRDGLRGGQGQDGLHPLLRGGFPGGRRPLLGLEVFLEDLNVAVPGVPDVLGIRPDGLLVEVQGAFQVLDILGLATPTPEVHQAVRGGHRLLLLPQGPVHRGKLQPGLRVVRPLPGQLLQDALGMGPVPPGGPGPGELQAGLGIARTGLQEELQLLDGVVRPTLLPVDPGQLDPEPDLLGIQGDHLAEDLLRLPLLAQGLQQEAVELEGFQVVGTAAEDVHDRVPGLVVVPQGPIEPGQAEPEAQVVGHHLHEPLDFLEGLGLAAALLQEALDVLRGLEEARIGLQGRPVLPDGLVDLAGFRERDAQAVAGFRVPGGHGQDLVEDVRGLPGLPVPGQGQTVAVHGFRPARPGLHGLLVFPERVLGLAHGLVGDAQVEVEGGIVLVHRQALPEHLDGLLVVPPGHVHGAQGVQGQDVPGILLHRPGEGHLRGLQVPHLAVDAALVEQELRVVRGQLEPPGQGGQGVVQAAQAQVDGPQVLQGPDVLGVPLHDGGEGPQGGLEAVGPEIDRAQDEAGVPGLGFLDQVVAGQALRGLEVPEAEGVPGPLQGVRGRVGGRHGTFLAGRADTSRENSPGRRGRTAS